MNKELLIIVIVAISAITVMVISFLIVTLSIYLREIVPIKLKAKLDKNNIDTELNTGNVNNNSKEKNKELSDNSSLSK